MSLHKGLGEQARAGAADVVIVVPLACVMVELSILYVMARRGSRVDRLQIALANVAGHVSAGVNAHS